MRPGGRGISPNRLQQATDLPEPDSPIMAVILPDSTLKLTLSTALLVPIRVTKLTLRLCTSSTGSVLCAAHVQRVAQSVTEEIERKQCQRQSKTRKQ